MEYLNLLRSQFNNRVRLTEKRPGILQLQAPLFHEDGDMIDIFLELPKNGGKIKVCDFGMTLMRLSYNFEIDTPNKERILHRILSENQVTETDGNLCIETTSDSLYPTILQFAQVVGKVSNMQLYKREIAQSLFYELLQEYVDEKLGEYRPTPNVLPMPNRDDLEVDWQLTLPSSQKSVYVFAVKDSAKSRIVTISCLEFQKNQLPFVSLVVHEGFENLPKKDRTRITSAVDKQFVSLDDFTENAVGYLKRAA